MSSRVYLFYWSTFWGQAQGPALQKADIVMSHVSPFDLPLNRPEGFTLGLVLDVDYFPDAREMSASTFKIC